MSKGKTESSISLRLITSAMAMVGILAACKLADTAPALALMGILGTAFGSYVSYIRRDANNTWIKWAIATGMIVVLGVFLDEIIYRIQSSIADARAPLTNMLIALQCLHSFDLPKRRDLNLSALVGLTLISSAATLSRDLSFGIYLLSFVCFGFYMLYLDCVSRTMDSAQPIGRPLGQATAAAAGRKRVAPPVLLVTVLPLLALGVFLIMPKMDIGLLHNVRVSLRLNLPMLQSSRVTNPMLTRSRFGDGSLAVNPLAYFGFDEQLDLNYRGRLSEQVVMKISSPQGAFLRAMAFDIYDGHHWSMSRPKQTYLRLTTYGSAIPLSPVPSLPIPRQVPISELTQVVQMEVDQPNLIPAAAVPDLIYFPTNKVEVDTYGALRSPVLMEKDMVYTVFSHVPQYNLEQLRQAADVAPSDRAIRRQHLNLYLQLPQTLPPGVVQLAASAAGNSGNVFQKAEAIDRYLKANYRYNFNIPPTPDNQDVVADFLLKRKSGYCEHFASSFVVMCRSQQIPARLVTGFTPGEYNPFTGLWEVAMKDAHAWAEIYMPGWGWIPFDPTPEGAPPGFSGKYAQSAADYFNTHIWRNIELLLADPKIKSFTAMVVAWFKPLPSVVSWFSFFVVAVWQPLAVTLPLLAILLFMYKLVPIWARHKGSDRQLKTAPELHASTNEYLRFCRTIKRLNIERLPQETAQELKRRVETKIAQVEPGREELLGLVDDFVDCYGRARFGASGGSELMALNAKIQAKLETGASDNKIA